MKSQHTVHVIQRMDSAAALLHPIRTTILDHLRTPESATGVARELGLPRQRINYHVRELEKNGLLQHITDRRRGNCTERIVQSTARSYVISPGALGPLGADPGHLRDRFSSAYLVAAAARSIRDVGYLRDRADAAGKRLATLTLEANVRFASPEAQHAFAEDLSGAVAEVVKKYHDDGAEHGRAFTFVVSGYPSISSPLEESAPPDATRSGEG